MQGQSIYFARNRLIGESKSTNQLLTIQVSSFISLLILSLHSKLVALESSYILSPLVSLECILFGFCRWLDSLQLLGLATSQRTNHKPRIMSCLFVQCLVWPDLQLKWWMRIMSENWNFYVLLLKKVEWFVSSLSQTTGYISNLLLLLFVWF